MIQKGSGEQLKSCDVQPDSALRMARAGSRMSQEEVSSERLTQRDMQSNGIPPETWGVHNTSDSKLFYSKDISRSFHELLYNFIPYGKTRHGKTRPEQLNIFVKKEFPVVEQEKTSKSIPSSFQGPFCCYLHQTHTFTRNCSCFHTFAQIFVLFIFKVTKTTAKPNPHLRKLISVKSWINLI